MPRKSIYRKNLQAICNNRFTLGQPKEKLEKWKRIKSQEIALIENPGEYVEDVSEMNIRVPSIEETELARKRADSVTDARMVILGNMSSSEIQEMF